MKLHPAQRRDHRASGRHLAVVIAGAALLSAVPVAANNGRSLNGRWTPQGPSPIFFAQVDIPEDDQASGALNAVAAHPHDPDILFVGSVNGGIWRTLNATDPFPDWTPLTDELSAQSISELEFDPTDRKARTLVAGFGATSSLGNLSGPLPGLAITRNLGHRWKLIGDELAGATITGVAARGRHIVAAARSTVPFAFPIPLGDVDGLWRSRNRGRSFEKVSGAPGSGLPPGSVYDLVGDPEDPSVLYAAVVFGAAGDNGIYRSDDTGATWTRVSDAALDAAIEATPPGPANVEIAVGHHDNVFVSVVGSNGAPFFGALTALFRSGNGGGSWTSLDLPSTQEAFLSFGLHPGQQGAIHNSVAADPSDEHLVYLGGDRQPGYTEPVFSSPVFPNSIGAVTFGGRLFRCDASLPVGSQCVHLTDCAPGGAGAACAAPQVAPVAGGGTANDSAPHADSRHMIFDAGGNLIEVDDGGVYRLDSPSDNTGSWVSVNGDLQVHEQHSQIYDSVAGINFAGSQDNGTPMQEVSDDPFSWFLWVGGDGGDVASDPTAFPFTGLGLSARYTSAQFLGVFNLSLWDADSNFFGFLFLPLTPLDGTPGPLVTAQFYTPIELNAVEAGRLVIGGSDGVYETLDAGSTVRRVGTIQALGSGRNPFGYGSSDNPDVLYVGGGPAGLGVFDEIHIRTDAPPAGALVESTSFPGKGSGLSIRGIAVNPEDSAEAFVVNGSDVFHTTDTGTSWTTLTRHLTRKAVTPFRSVLFVPGSGSAHASPRSRHFRDGILIVGASNGAFVASERNGFRSWRRLGRDLPEAQVYDLHYDAESNSISAGTISRGAWELSLSRGGGEGKGKKK